MTWAGSTDVFWPTGVDSSSEDVDWIRESGQSIIAAKDAEIARLHQEIDEAERSINEAFQLCADADAQTDDEIAQMEHELQSLSVGCEAELHSVEDEYNREIWEVTRSHEKEIGCLRKDLRPSDHRYLSGQIPVFGGEEEALPSDLTPELDAARSRLMRLRAEGRRLESEFDRLNAVRQRALTHRVSPDRARRTPPDQRRRPPAGDVQAAEERLRKAKAKNERLDRELADAVQRMLERAQERRQRPPRRELTAIDAEIIRLCDENELLRGVLRDLDKLAYDANRRRTEASVDE
jgi:hypothetical protein